MKPNSVKIADMKTTVMKLLFGRTRSNRRRLFQFFTWLLVLIIWILIQSNYGIWLKIPAFIILTGFARFFDVFDIREYLHFMRK